MIRTHTFNGVRFSVYINEDGIDGYCDNLNESTPEYEIALLAPLNSKNGLDVAIHEAIHACCPKLPEGDVMKLASELARWLWRLGYRRPDNG